MSDGGLLIVLPELRVFQLKISPVSKSVVTIYRIVAHLSGIGEPQREFWKGARYAPGQHCCAITAEAQVGAVRVSSE
jgi:hypothetical protein